MKKSTKITLIVAVVLMLVGGIVALVCMVLGADLDDLTFYIDNPLKQEDNGADPYDPIYAMPGSEAADTWTFDKEKIRALELDVEAGTLVIKTTPEDVCRVIVEHGRKGLRCQVKNGVLLIEENDSIYTLLDWSGDSTPGIVVVLSENLVKENILESVQVSIGAGQVEVSGLAAQKLDIDVDAGNFQAEDLTVSGRCELDVDAGGVNIHGGQIQGGLYVDVDAGSVVYQGVLDCDWQVDCDAGSVAMDLTEMMTDHNYRVEYNMGTVQIGSTEFEGMSDQAYLDYQAPYLAQIQCDVGEVKVSFFHREWR